MKNKLLLISALLCTVAQGVWSLDKTPVTFVERSWNKSLQKVEETSKTITDYEELYLTQGDHWLAIGNDKYYVVKKSDAFYQTLKVYGRAHLILCDGATLRCSGGIRIEKADDTGNAELHIYSESDGDGQGKLIVTNSYDGAAGIGGSSNTVTGDIHIHGGWLDIHGGDEAAGIGGGLRQNLTLSVYETKATGGHIYIYGGTIRAEGGDYAAGIGGGGSDGKSKPGGSGGEINIYGGAVTAQGGYRGAGIGSGNCGYDYTNLEYSPTSGNLNFYGGNVTATGGEYGAGIGGGCNSGRGHVTVSGGTIHAYGGEDAAGIGGGENGNGCITTVTGGYVYAKGKSYGSGIGGGECSGSWGMSGTDTGLGNKVTITGGEVFAIAGDDCKCRNPKCGSAIGTGDDVPDKDNIENCGKINLGESIMVTGGDSESNIERVFTAPERVAACIWRNFVHLQTCPHTVQNSDNAAEAITYATEETSHTLYCRYCTKTITSPHSYVDGRCICGMEKEQAPSIAVINVHIITFGTSTNYEGAPPVVLNIINGKNFMLPQPADIEGLIFMGYLKSASAPSGIEMTDAEASILVDAGQPLVANGDEIYYARYRYDYDTRWTWAPDLSSATVSISSSLTGETLDIEATYLAEDESMRVEPQGTEDGMKVYRATSSYQRSDDVTYQFTSSMEETIYNIIDIKLSDTGSDNDRILNSCKNRMANVTFEGRTLYKDGDWNTLCLPFSIPLSCPVLQDATVKTLESSEFANGVLTLHFRNASSIDAGKPYIVKWQKPEGYDNNPSAYNITDPLFSNVILSRKERIMSSQYVYFESSFSPIFLDEDDDDVLYLGASNKLYRPSAPMTVGSFRAVFRLLGLTASDLDPNLAHAFVLNFSDDEDPTAITSQEMVNGQSSVANGQWYTLDGRRLSGKPTEKGIYIVDGKKVAIK